MGKVAKKDKKPNPAARKRFYLPTGGEEPTVLDKEMLSALAATMLPIESIAVLCKCSKDTLYAKYSDVLQTAREGRKQTLAMAMWEKGLIEKDTKMLIWLSKQHLGYRDVMPEEAAQVNFNVYTNEVPK